MTVPRYRVEIGISNFLNIRRGLENFDELNKEELFFFNSASEAITFYLKNISRGKRLKVGVPLYACRSVYHSVMSSGNDLDFVDIGLDRSGYQIDNSKLGNLDVLIFVHYFGAQYDKIDEIKKRFPQLRIIEDCSHVTLKKFNRNIKSPNPAVFSFNFHKPVPAGIGGALFLDVGLRTTDLMHHYNSLPTVTVSENCMTLLSIFLQNYAFSPLIYASLQYALKKKRHRPRINVRDITHPRKIAGVGKYLLGNQMHNEHDVTDLYKKLPKQLTLNVGCETLSYFPLFLKSEFERDGLLNELRHQKIDGYILWENVFYNANFYGLRDPIHFPITRDMLSRILFIPEPSLWNSIKFEQLMGIIVDYCKLRESYQ